MERERMKRRESEHFYFLALIVEIFVIKCQSGGGGGGGWSVAGGQSFHKYLYLLGRKIMSKIQKKSLNF